MEGWKALRLLQSPLTGRICHPERSETESKGLLVHAAERQQAEILPFGSDEASALRAGSLRSAQDLAFRRISKNRFKEVGPASRRDESQRYKTAPDESGLLDA
jgi:hypothetical protein